eukprot:TRINITY_DN7766_c0_g1_i1.p1 TRINITY_DN7766_c0_g1~~TRINITY_DN7766_c0_g1_i1.p1  ORF type:complete len:161 (+),score=64.34 TRINITY_DN7766_c0_g1_i1:27-485(+)
MDSSSPLGSPYQQRSNSGNLSSEDIPSLQNNAGNDENSPLRVYERKHDEQIREQAKASQEKHEEQKKAAKEEVNKILEERAAKIEQNKARNREEEENERGSRKKAEEDRQHSWERVSQMIDFNATKPEGKDTSTFKRVLLEAKHLPKAASKS